MLKRIFISLLLLGALPLCASSIRLFNDSPYKLRAVIRGADGSYLGEMILLPQRVTTWDASLSNGGKSQYVTGPNVSLTPYTVHWYCINGDEYSICTQVSTGGAVTAKGCEGTRMCKPPAPPPPTVSPGEQPDLLPDQNSLPQPTPEELTQPEEASP